MKYLAVVVVLLGLWAGSATAKNAPGLCPAWKPGGPSVTTKSAKAVVNAWKLKHPSAQDVTWSVYMHAHQPKASLDIYWTGGYQSIPLVNRCPLKLQTGPSGATIYIRGIGAVTL